MEVMLILLAAVFVLAVRSSDRPRPAPSTRLLGAMAVVSTVLVYSHRFA